MDTMFKESAITPKLGAVKPIDIFSLERREIDEKTVTDLMEALVRDGRFLQDIGVRDEGASGYRLIFGANRLEAWKRHFGEQTPIPAKIFPSETPDARIKRFELEENLIRNDLTAAERTATEMRWVATFKEELSGGNPVTPVTQTGEAAESGNPIPISTRAHRGRGNKGMALQVADKFGIGKRAVNMRRQSAAALIGEEIDFDLDTPEELKRKAAELERKAAERQRAEPKVAGPKRRNPAPRGGVEDPMPLAKPHAGKIGRLFESLWKVFIAIGEKYQLWFIYHACLHRGLDPLRMAPPAAFRLADEDLELDVALPPEVAPAIDEAAVDLDPGERDDAAVAHAEEDDEAAAGRADQGDDGGEFGAEDLQAAGDDASGDADDDEDADDNVSEAVDPEDFGAEDLETADDVHEAADQSGGAMKCAYCTIEFESGDQLEEFDGKLYHHFCVEDGKELAKAKQGKQIAIAA